MTRRSHYIFKGLTLLRLLSDMAIVPIALIVGYSLKFKIGWVFQNIFSIEYGTIYAHAQIESYLSGVGIMWVLWISSFYFVGMYRQSNSVMPMASQSVKIMKGVTIATVEAMALTFLLAWVPGSRFVLFYMGLSGVILLLITRFIWHKIEMSFLKKGIGSRAAIVIGGDEFAQDIIERMILYPGLRLHYAGSICNRLPERLHYHLRDRFNKLGTIGKSIAIIQKENPDIIFVTEKTNEEILNQITTYCENNGIELRIFSDIAPYLSGTATLENFDGLPYITHAAAPVKPVEHAIKFVLDRIVAVWLLVVLSPLLLGIAIMIKIGSPKGPILYIQERVGKGGRPFGMIKFRTMIPDAESKTGPTMVDEENEDRYIPSGKWLRQTSLDELPQLWNVLVGDMSIVGPRPERPHFVDAFSKDIPNFNLRHQIRGGITGWAQINGRSVLTRRPDHKLKYDLYYIYNWSLAMDLKILLATLFVVWAKEEAY